VKSKADRVVGLLFGGIFAVLFFWMAGHVVLRLIGPEPPGVGDEAPAFALPSAVDGETVATEELTGMVLLVDFWQTTCAGCVGAVPKLNRLFARYRDRGFLVIGVNAHDSEADIRDFVAKRPVEYPVVVDPGDVTSAYGIYATPTVLLIGADGRIVAKHVGAVTQAMLAKEIEAALKAAQPRVGRADPQPPSTTTVRGDLRGRMPPQMAVRREP
jgi:peroxiredoxin